MAALFDIVKNYNGNIQTVAEYLTKSTVQKRQLLNIILQLTPVCNFKCKMCYARLDNEQIEAQGKHILRFHEWKYFIDEAVRLGALNLTLTGGECTIHPDFAKIYSYAYDMGLDIIIMSNGSYLSDELFDLFVSKPPACFSITLYGGNENTYDVLCKNKAGFKASYDNVNRLIDAGFLVRPKVTLVKDNINDYEEMDEYFFQRKLKLMVSATLDSFNSCDKETMEENSVDKGEYIKLSQKIWKKRNGYTDEESEEKTLELVENFCGTLPKEVNVTKGVPCNAGRNTCHITWDGQMTPCVTMDSFSVDTMKYGFEESFIKMVEYCDEVPRLVECSTCPHATKCLKCIAAHYCDTGEYGVVSERLCWKRQNPEKAKKIEQHLLEKGLL